MESASLTDAAETPSRYQHVWYSIVKMLLISSDQSQPLAWKHLRSNSLNMLWLAWYRSDTASVANRAQTRVTY